MSVYVQHKRKFKNKIRLFQLGVYIYISWLTECMETVITWIWLFPFSHPVWSMLPKWSPFTSNTSGLAKLWHVICPIHIPYQRLVVAILCKSVMKPQTELTRAILQLNSTNDTKLKDTFSPSKRKGFTRMNGWQWEALCRSCPLTLVCCIKTPLTPRQHCLKRSLAKIDQNNRQGHKNVLQPAALALFLS